MIVHLHDYPNLLNTASDVNTDKKMHKHTKNYKSNYFQSVYRPVCVCPFNKGETKLFCWLQSAILQHTNLQHCAEIHYTTGKIFYLKNYWYLNRATLKHTVKEWSILFTNVLTLPFFFQKLMKT